MEKSPVSCTHPCLTHQATSEGCGGEKVLLHAKAELMKHSPWKWLFWGPGNPQKEGSWTGHAVLWEWWGYHWCIICVHMSLRQETLPLLFLLPSLHPPPPSPCLQCLAMRKRVKMVFFLHDYDTSERLSCGIFFSFHFSLGNHLHMLIALSYKTSSLR